MKKLIIAMIALSILTGCERRLPVECDVPLKMYDELIGVVTDENIKNHLIVLRNKTEYDAKHASTEHFAIVACASTYQKIESLKQKFNLN
ncbi:hypothetical protein RCS94_05635 [Orbaceae bacterium ac157xtp]